VPQTVILPETLFTWGCGSHDGRWVYFVWGRMLPLYHYSQHYT